MLLKVGQYYKDTDGNKCGPMRKRTDVRWVYAGSNDIFFINGSSCFPGTPNLVSEWVEPKAEPRPFGELSDVEQGALLLASYKSEKIEFWSERSVTWLPQSPFNYSWRDDTIYRIGPELITGTVELINGEPDFTTWEKSDD
jgi:hypothetical protein